MPPKTNAGTGASEDGELAVPKQTTAPSRGRRGEPVGVVATAASARKDTMAELRARQLLVLLRSTHFNGVARLDRRAFEVLGKLGLHRTWVSQASNRLIADELVEARIEDGACTLRLTERGREAT